MSNREWSLKRLNTEVVASGPKSAEDMTREQAREAFEQVLKHEWDPTTLGAFWLANRWKHNTPTELAGFLDVMVEQSVEQASPDVDVVDCGANYDGKHTTALLGVASGVTAAAAGTPVVVHSGDRIPTLEGCAYKHVLDELGVRTDITPTDSAAMVEEVGFGFYYQPQFNPGVDALLDRRQQMGVRTFLNTIETLANPAAANTHIGSFFHYSFAEKLLKTLQASQTQSIDRAVFFQGLEGYDDCRPSQMEIAEWRSGEAIEQWQLSPPDHDISFEREDLAVDSLPADSATLTRAVLAGKQTGPVRDAVLINAAIRLYAAEAVDSIEGGIDRARAAIEDGQAKSTLERLQAY